MRDTGIAGTAGMRSLIRWLPAIPVLLALLSCAPERVPVGQDVTGEVESRLRVKIESGRGISQFTCRQEILCGSSVIPVFYERRGFAPAWSGRDGRFPLADSLIAAIRDLVDALRTGTKLPAGFEEEDDVAYALGSLWGAHAARLAGWEWAWLQLDDGFDGFAILPEDQAYAVWPHHFVYGLITQPEEERMRHQAPHSMVVPRM